ncbi:serine/threonine kinase [Aureococcus anophagefferens]|nr:serine/threonine kinase [Aureococcus anophagefferens]
MRSSTFWNLLKGSSKERHPSPTTVTKTPLTNSVSPPASPKTSDADSDDARSSSCASTTKPPEPDEAKKSHRRLHSDPERFSRGKKRACGLCGAHAGDVLEPLTEPLMGEGHPLKPDAANPANDAPHRVDAVEDAASGRARSNAGARGVAPGPARREPAGPGQLRQGPPRHGRRRAVRPQVRRDRVARDGEEARARGPSAALELLRGHANVLTLLGAWRAPGALHIVTECAWGGELFRHLQRKKRRARGAVHRRELSSALVHAHGHRVAYRDVKPENVLFDARGHVLLADFGFRKSWTRTPNLPSSASRAAPLCGTPEYMAPEVLNRVDYGGNVDWWALGMLTAELVTGLPPWYTEDRVELFRRVRYAPLQARYLVAPDKLASGDPLARDTAYFVEALLKRGGAAGGRRAGGALLLHRVVRQRLREAGISGAALQPHARRRRRGRRARRRARARRRCRRGRCPSTASEPPPPPPPPALLGSSAALRRNFEIDGDRLCLTADEIALEVASAAPAPPPPPVRVGLAARAPDHPAWEYPP